MEKDAGYVEVLDYSFLEFSGSRPELLHDLFEKMGFAWKSHGEMKLYNIGNVHFISNPSHGGSAERFRNKHIRGASAMGFKVADSKQAFEKAVQLGAKPAQETDLDIPAIQGVGESLIYLVDDAHEQALFQKFGFTKGVDTHRANAIQAIDHLTHNLHQGGVARMCEFYEKIFGFERIRKFDIDGKKTGLVSEVVESQNGTVTIPLNESKDEISQIAEFVKEYNGEGIQHIALLCDDICSTVDSLSHNGIPFQDTPDTYYEMIDERLPGHGEEVDTLRQRRILIDGGEAQGGGFLLQIFTQNSIGPIFFEFIERKGNEGFGEGNFQALFESIELDQERRGVL